MFKVLMMLACSLGIAAAAQAEVVVLKSKVVYESSKGEKSISFSSKACGLKAIAFAFKGKQISYVRYSQAIASFQTGSDWGVDRDIFNHFGLSIETSQNFECKRVFRTASS